MKRVTGVGQSLGASVADGGSVGGFRTVQEFHPTGVWLDFYFNINF